MSVRSYSKIWLHLVWSTFNREKLLIDRNFRKEVSHHLHENATIKGLYMKVNFVNEDHVHTLIDLPPDKTVEETVRLLKGESSFWINAKINSKFQWARGYGVFSVSESNCDKLVKYIISQEEHHRKRTFMEEYEMFIRAYNLKYSNS